MKSWLRRTGANCSCTAGLIVLTLSGERVKGITRFLDNSVQHHFAPSLASQGTGRQV